MKKALFFWKRLSSSPFFSRSSMEPQNATAPGARASAASWSTETEKSGKSAPKGPSYFLRLSCFALLVAGFLTVRKEASVDDKIPELLTHDWFWIENPCHPAVAGEFFEVSGEEESVELYVVDGSRALASRESLPEPPYSCSKIPFPTYIKEI